MGSCRYRLNIFPVSSPVVKRKHFSQLRSQKYTGYPFDFPELWPRNVSHCPSLEVREVESVLPELTRKKYHSVEAVFLRECWALCTEEGGMAPRRQNKQTNKQHSSHKIHGSDVTLCADSSLP